MLAALNHFALCTNFTLLQESPIHTRSSRVYTGGVGSAHCRKICSLKRHVPFDALYIIRKVKAVTVRFLARSFARSLALSRRKRWAFDFSQPNFDNLYRTSAIADICYCRMRSSIILVVGIDQHFRNSAFAQTLFAGMRNFCLRDFDTLSVSFLDYYASRSTRQITGEGAYRMSRDTTCRRLVSVNWRRSWRRVSD